MAVKKSIADKIHRLVIAESKKQGIHRAAIAKKIGVNTTTVHRMFHGNDTGYKKVFKMLDVLGITVTLKTRKKRKVKR